MRKLLTITQKIIGFFLKVINFMIIYAQVECKIQSKVSVFSPLLGNSHYLLLILESLGTRFHKSSKIKNFFFCKQRGVFFLKVQFYTLWFSRFYLDFKTYCVVWWKVKLNPVIRRICA